jgi:hypothetical protein
VNTYFTEGGESSSVTRTYTFAQSLSIPMSVCFANRLMAILRICCAYFDMAS